jgi:glutamine amidotransferase
MTVKVTLVDYGIGNIYSVRRALETAGADVLLTGLPADIEVAERLVLPGVGAFADCMSGLRERGLIDPLLHYAATGRPLLGICVGMQMLATASEEFGEHAGLGLVPGRVAAVPSVGTEGQALKIPHTGWTALRQPSGVTWQDSPLADTREGESVYVVHSYAMQPVDPAHRLADCEYGGHRICAAVRRERIFGYQFHPEKSGPAGLRMLECFLAC